MFYFDGNACNLIEIKVIVFFFERFMVTPLVAIFTSRQRCPINPCKFDILIIGYKHSLQKSENANNS